MEFSLLGPLRMHEQGCSYTPTAPKQRQLLSLLLLNANQVVSTRTCIEELWENTPPNTALSTVQSYILQLRRILRRVPRVGSLEAARRILETRDGGYLLTVRGEELDTNQFATLVASGRSKLYTDDVAAAELLGRALALWQGSVLADVQVGPVVRAYAVGLEEDRMSVQEQRIDADLRLGRRPRGARRTEFADHQAAHPGEPARPAHPGDVPVRTAQPGPGGRPPAAYDAP